MYMLSLDPMYFYIFRTKVSGSIEAREATYHCQNAARHLENVLKVENAALGVMVEGPRGALPPLGSSRPGGEEVTIQYH